MKNFGYSISGAAWATAAALASGGCDLSSDVDAAGVAAARPAASIASPSILPDGCADAELAVHQADLLDAAIEAASKIPLDPHHKDRARMQAQVVAACLELNQPGRALRCLQRIENWRRGAAYAELARHCITRNPHADVDIFLQHAHAIADHTDDWRKVEVEASIARATAWRANPQQALTREEFQAGVAALDAAIATGDFEFVKISLRTYLEHFDRFYSDAERRDLAESRLLASHKTLPVLLRVELMLDTARASLTHGDSPKAMTLIERAQELCSGYQWLAEDYLPVLSKLARLRHDAGDPTGAQALIAQARAIYDAGRDTMIDIDRAGALRPVAEALAHTGDHAGAIAVYARALEEGVVNPNSRPRAEDLAATCCSLALAGVPPDAHLLARIRSIQTQLGSPW